MTVKYGDYFFIEGGVNVVKTSVYLKGIENKRIIILASKKEKSIETKNKITNINGRGFNYRTFIYCDSCKNCIIDIIPTNLKKNKVCIEPIESEKLYNILNRKFRRINN